MLSTVLCCRLAPAWAETEENLQRIRAALNERIERANLSSSISRVAAVEGPLMGPDEFKLNRLRLRRDYASGALRPFSVSKAQEAEASDALLLRIRAIVAAAVNRSPDDVAPDADFFLDLGGTSLDYFAMLTKLRDEFDAAFPLEETGLKTARAIADYIRAEKGGSRGV